MRTDPLTKKITKAHKIWLRNVQTSVEMKVAFDYVDITPRRIDILFEMGLVELVSGKYQLTEKGKTAIL